MGLIHRIPLIVPPVKPRRFRRVIVPGKPRHRITREERIEMAGLAYSQSYVSLGGSPASDRPTWNGGAGQTAILALDHNDSWFDNITAAGATGARGKGTAVPFPSPYWNSTAVPASVSLQAGMSSGQAIRLQYTNGMSPSDIRLIMAEHGGTAARKINVNTFRFKVAGATSEFAIKFNHWRTTGNDPQFCLHGAFPFTSGSGKHTFFQYYDAGYNDTGNSDDQATQPHGPYFQDFLNDGIWHLCTSLFQCSTSAGSYDYRAEMWIDDTQVIKNSFDAVNITPEGGEKPWTTTQMYQGSEHPNITMPSTEGFFLGGALTTSGISSPVQIDINLGTGDIEDDNSVRWWTINAA